MSWHIIEVKFGLCIYTDTYKIYSNFLILPRLFLKVHLYYYQTQILIQTCLSMAIGLWVECFPWNVQNVIHQMDSLLLHGHIFSDLMKMSYYQDMILFHSVSVYY